MARINSNFRLGLDRKQLIEAAKIFGRTEQSAKKASTKTLEQYIINQVSGKKGTPIPEFSERRRKDISNNVRDYGIHDAVHSISYHTKRSSGNQDETNYLRLTIGRAFRGFIGGIVTNEMIDELVIRLDFGTINEIISGLEGGENSYYYLSILEDYAEELKEEERKRNEAAEKQAQEQFETGGDSSPSKRKSKTKKRR